MWKVGRNFAILMRNIRGCWKALSQATKSGRSPPLFEDYTKASSSYQPEYVLIRYQPDHWQCINGNDAIEMLVLMFYLQKPISRVDVIEGESNPSKRQENNKKVTGYGNPSEEYSTFDHR